jgi:oligoribonuclease NrnB/cAMP/cGMP phosphodiesterase (DHH superfamily)
MTKILDVQEKIKQALDRMGWSQRRFAEVLFYEITDDEVDESEETLEKFYEKVKKYLRRPTTSIDLLESYFVILVKQAEYKKAHLVHETSARLGFVDHSILKAVSSVGKDLLEQIDLAEREADDL